jgi:mannosidase alpha-like ER degradation enhancer 2
MRSTGLRGLVVLLLLSLLVAGTVLAAKPTPTPQPSATGFRSGAADRVALAALVRSEVQRTWLSYKQYAWGYDELNPLSKTGRNWYAVSLLMTPVDALDTLLVMGFKQEADEARELIATKLDFNQDMFVKGFEINIRLLGGLLSGYQLTGDQRLLAKAKDLGDRLLPLFESPTGMPYVDVNLKTRAVRNPRSNPAEVGTYLIELGTLSKLTGNPVYYDKAKRALIALYSRRSAIGLVGEAIDVESGKWLSSTSHVGACIDSYYEYLYKSYKLFGDQDCLKMWQTHIHAANEYVSDEVRTGLWYGRVDMNTGARGARIYGALDAFFAGLLALSGDFGRATRLEESGYAMWHRYGVEPELIDYLTLEATSPGYVLRPEVIESAYVLHYFTRDPRYLEMGLTFAEGLMMHCRTDAGFAALESVVTKGKRDNMESFFLAETMKYLYLLFAPPDTIDLRTTVFNTEAHPVRKTW